MTTLLAEQLETSLAIPGTPEVKREIVEAHIHDFRKVPKRERTDRMKFVCAMFKCECGEWYYV